MSSRLEVRDIHKRYGGVQALEAVSFGIAAGEVVGLIGPNGAGKTTLIDIITGTQRSDRGEVYLEGRKLTGPAVKRSRSGLARTFQHQLIAEELTAVENIAIGSFTDRFRTVPAMVGSLFHGAWGYRSRPPTGEFEQLANDLGISRTRAPGRDLTLGERRLVEVGRAISSEPAVLLLDEPFAGSDAAGIDGIRHAVALLRERRRAVLLIDHNVDLVASLADRMVLLDGGRTVFDGLPEECLQSPEMKEVYFG